MELRSEELYPSDEEDDDEEDGEDDIMSGNWEENKSLLFGAQAFSSNAAALVLSNLH